MSSKPIPIETITEIQASTPASAAAIDGRMSIEPPDKNMETTTNSCRLLILMSFMTPALPLGQYLVNRFNNRMKQVNNQIERTRHPRHHKMRHTKYDSGTE